MTNIWEGCCGRREQCSVSLFIKKWGERCSKKNYGIGWSTVKYKSRVYVDVSEGSPTSRERIGDCFV